MAFALRFISGKYQGGEFPLEENRDVVVGRSSDLDMVLVEEMVSRKHAKLRLRGGRVDIEDLGSTNGTFVNGERISQANVGEGDRILIGSNILRVVTVGRAVSVPGQAENLGQTAVTETSPSSNSVRRVRRAKGETGTDVRMSGDLQEIPLPDLLQLFGTSKKDGVLLVDTGVSVGRIVIKKGVLHHASLSLDGGDAEPLPPLKAIYRMVGWSSGVFELDPPEEADAEEPIDLSVQAVLMEAFRQKDELAQLQSKLPSWEAELRLPDPLTAKLTELEETQLNVWQMAINRRSVGATLDTSPLSDLDTATALAMLCRDGYLQVRSE